MTPMTRLKNNIDTFSQLISPVFKEVNLNKSAPKSFTTEFCGEYTTEINRGVENDFVKLFKTSDPNKYTMALVFDYIDLSEDEQKIQYSIKVDKHNSKFDYIVTSEKLSVNEFKEQINIVNKNLQQLDSMTYENIVRVVTNEFIPDLIKQTQYLAHVKTKRRKMK